MLAGAPTNEELNSLSTFNTRHRPTPDVQHKTRDLHTDKRLTKQLQIGP